MKLKLTYTLTDSEVLDITREMGYGEAVKDIDCVAPVIWPEDFMNDCYKYLCIDDGALDEAIEDVEFALNASSFDEDYHNDCVAKEYIIKALRKYCRENHIDTDYILVDVSW